MNNFEELKKAALGANLHGWTGFEDALNDDGYSEAVSKFIGHCRPSEILALIAQLEAKNIRADACVNAFEGIETERFAGKSIGEFLAGEVRLNKAEPKPDGSFGFTFSGLAIQIMAESFADQFKSSGAVNYLELLFDHSEVGPLTVTMQRVDGLTPAQKLATAEAALSAANEKPKPISFDELADAVKHVTGGIRIEFDPKFDKGHQAVPFMNFNSLSRIVEMYRSTETYHLAGFTVEGE